MTAVPIEVDHLTKRFGTRRGIEDVSLRVHEGEVFGFLGPNGAGKSTTIRCLLGLYRPTSGRTVVLGQDSQTAGAAFRSDVGYLPGELRLPESLSGADLVRRFARLRRLSDMTYRDELVERFQVPLDRPLRLLSTGNKQKLGIVLAFMHRPRLLILDEPTSGLDPLLQGEFGSLLRETADDGRTVLLSSHDLDEVQRVVNRLAIIRTGQIVVDSSVRTLRERAPQVLYLTFDRDVDEATLFAQSDVTVSRLGARQIAITYTGSVAPLLDSVAALRPIAIEARPPSLDELFLQWFGKQREVAA